ncbi:MLP-like protein 34 [Chenopodium quinoa]|uniref:MLP-like protein 34 n=1 Tax=Chenopodium quinoa TaxID=63459 RepID=UPI000B785076|nr:MLP-like protein 34 [Chenopodium quinoa]XP_021766624.1 MLP-like protein 34 [Chenopodium quinoa]
MAQLRSVEGQVELKCHADNFFDVWAGKAHLISKISPNKIAKVELVEGEWNKVGAVISWTYLIDDNGETSLISAKTRVEELNFKNRSLS